VISGVLLGFEGQQRQGLPESLRPVLEEAIVQAANLALADVVRHRIQDEVRGVIGLEGHSVALALNHAFPLLSDSVRSGVDYDALLPIMVGCAFQSSEGLSSGFFLVPVDDDIVPSNKNSFTWSPRSKSFRTVQRISSSPIVSTMGPFSRLIAHSVEQVRDSQRLLQTCDELLAFTSTLVRCWRDNKLSEIDISEEAEFLSHEAMTATVPALWKLLKTAMFAVVVVLRAIIGRALGDGNLAADNGLIPVHHATMSKD
jgi:hypothetical protein